MMSSLLLVAVLARAIQGVVLSTAGRALSMVAPLFTVSPAVSTLTGGHSIVVAPSGAISSAALSGLPMVRLVAGAGLVSRAVPAVFVSRGLLWA